MKTDTTKCPTCGQSVSSGDALGRLIESLREHSGRDVYRCHGGGYAVSYGGITTLGETIYEAERRGLIRRKWADKPELECWVLA